VRQADRAAGQTAPSRGWFWAAVLPALGLLAYQQKLFWRFTCEDAFISFRYARNLAEGHGLVFNPGVRVEGFSNPLWTLVLALYDSVGGELTEGSKLLGLLAAGATLVLSSRLALHLSGRDPDRPLAGVGAALVTALLFSVDVSVRYYASSGLETMLQALLITAGASCYAMRRFGWALAWFTLAAVGRPEGLALLGVAVLFRVGERLVSRETFRRREGMAILAALCVLGALLGLRVLYYGDWLPNTFYAKPPDWMAGQPPRPWGGLRYTGWFLEGHGGYVILVLALLALARRDRLRDGLFMLAVLATGFGFVLYANFDWMVYHRFLAPYLGVLLAMATAGVVTACRRASSAWVPGAALAALLALGALPQKAASDWFVAHEGQYPNHLMSAQRLVELGRQLGETYGPGAVLATKRVGAVPFHSRQVTEDLLGLTDREIGRVVHREPAATRWPAIARIVLDREPDLLLVYPHAVLSDPDAPSQADLRSIPNPDREALRLALARGYRYASHVQTADAEYAYLYARKP
jgi:arabinofuranosyltransferase